LVGGARVRGAAIPALEPAAAHLRVFRLHLVRGVAAGAQRVAAGLEEPGDLALVRDVAGGALAGLERAVDVRELRLLARARMADEARGLGRAVAHVVGPVAGVRVVAREAVAAL